MRLMKWIRASRGGDRGFKMVTVMMSMMIVSLLGAGAYAATVGDMPVARKDQDRKRAYEAAQAGVDWYLNELRADPEGELAERVGRYKKQGLSPETAATVAAELTAKNALKAHLSAELNIDQDDVVSPWNAALASLIAFTVRAIPSL